MSNIFTRWFQDSTMAPVSNEAAIESATQLEKSLNSNYNYLTQLSRKNTEGICKINNLCQHLGLPILTNAQLRNIQYLLAGDAGEQLVSQAVNTIRGLQSVVIHNIILPYQYGQLNPNLDNQIDNLVITDTGVYCIEVKSRTLQNGEFDFRNLVPDIYQQIGYHKNALLKCLADANINFSSKAIRTIVVVVDRNGRTNFDITHQEKLKGHGSVAVSLDELILLLSNGIGNFYLNPIQMQTIANAIKKSCVSSKRSYPLNVYFNVSKQDLGRIRQLSLAVDRQLPIEQMVTYNSLFNNSPLVGLNARLQDMYWYIIGKLYRSGEHKTTFTRKELKMATCKRERNYARLDTKISTLARFMRKMEIFSKVEYNSGKLTVVVKDTYLRLFNSFNDDYCTLSYSLLRKIKDNYAKTLFRLLLQRSREGYYEASIEEIRRLLAVPAGYNRVTDIIKRAAGELIPYFKNLTYEYKRGRANKIRGVKFTFNPFDPNNLLRPI